MNALGCVLFVLLLPKLLFVHDAWLIPSALYTKSDQPVRLRLATSEAFPSCEVASAPGCIARLTLRDAAASRDDTVEADLRTLLATQAEAWNRGDIEGFMEGYWKSDRTTFASSGGVLRGWHALLDRYRRSYPNRAAMGRLEFSELEITRLGPDAALILGRWQLERKDDRPGGVFTLVARRFPESWRIVHDHTSTVAPAAPAKP